MWIVVAILLLAGLSVIYKRRTHTSTKPDTRRDVPCVPGYTKCPSGDCKGPGDRCS